MGKTGIFLSSVLILISCCIMMMSCDLEEDTLVWENTYGDTTVADSASSVIETKDGGFLICGFGYDFPRLILKTDSEGNQLWQHYHDSRASRMMETEGGDFILAGHYGSNIYLDRLDADGDLISQIIYTAGDNQDISSVAVTKDQGCLAACSLYKDGVLAGTYFVKLNAQGDMEWEETTGDYYTPTICQDNDGGYAVVGEAFSGKSRLLSFSKLDAEGNVLVSTVLRKTSLVSTLSLWITQKEYKVKTITAVSDGSYLLTGNMVSNIVIGGDSGSSHLGAFVIKISNEGSVTWERTFGGRNKYARHITETAGNEYVVTGARYYTGEEEYFSIWHGKLDANGTILLNNAFGESGINSYGKSVCATEDGGYIIVGERYNDGSVSSRDFYAAKFID